jgi:hypothetical protein
MRIVQMLPELSEGRYAMNEDSTIIRLRHPDAIDDPLTARAKLA